MKTQTTELNVDSADTETTAKVVELSDLQLPLVGGGSTDVTFY